MLKLEKINKKAGNFSLVDIDFTVGKGDYFTLIGESGAGKSMLLEIIMGIIAPDSGNILLNKKSILNTPTQKRKLGIVYQKPTLFPHMSVFENIAYPLKIKKFSKEEIKIKVMQLSEDTEITHLLKRNIGSLSGGEMQRVTIARTLATNPEILLLDEPLSFLDVQLKRGILALLRKLNQQGQTIIHVTHDYEEALSLTNKIAIIEHGSIIQTGTPQEVFQHPKSAFIAHFIGIGNFFKGHILASEHQSDLKFFKTSDVKFFTNTREEEKSEGYIMIPGEAIFISDEKLHSSAINNFRGTIKDIYQTRNGLEIVVDIGVELTAKISNFSFEKLQLRVGKLVWISFKASSIHFIKN
ncbi:MAG: ABC transporter [Bacteroidetes bacterium HGW-Bacteroidetes-16]|jgi:molybdopterin-binding protein|nr:MAG: ABC transporter [Bacteroidetes bacterium HGW-Bacteroidetes-16]